MPGRLLTIGVRPGVGKSAFAVNLIVEALKQQPELTVDMFSLEMSNAENYTACWPARLASVLANSSTHRKV